MNFLMRTKIGMMIMMMLMMIMMMIMMMTVMKIGIQNQMELRILKMIHIQVILKQPKFQKIQENFENFC